MLFGCARTHCRYLSTVHDIVISAHVVAHALVGGHDQRVTLTREDLDIVDQKGLMIHAIDLDDLEVR